MSSASHGHGAVLKPDLTRRRFRRSIASQSNLALLRRRVCTFGGSGAVHQDAVFIAVEFVIQRAASMAPERNTHPDSAGSSIPGTARLRPFLDQLSTISGPSFVIGLICTVLQHGIASKTVLWEFGMFSCLAMLILTTVAALRVYLHADRRLCFFENRRVFIFAAVWLSGAALLLVFGPVIPVWYSSSRGAALVAWSELFLLLLGLARLLTFVSNTTSRIPRCCSSCHFLD